MYLSRSSKSELRVVGVIRRYYRSYAEPQMGTFRGGWIKQRTRQVIFLGPQGTNAIVGPHAYIYLEAYPLEMFGGFNTGLLDGHYGVGTPHPGRYM